MRNPTAFLLRGLFLLALATAAAELVAHAPRAANVRSAATPAEPVVPALLFDGKPQGPFDDTPITPRETVAAFDRE